MSDSPYSSFDLDPDDDFDPEDYHGASPIFDGSFYGIQDRVVWTSGIFRQEDHRVQIRAGSHQLDSRIRYLYLLDPGFDGIPVGFELTDSFETANQQDLVAAVCLGEDDRVMWIPALYDRSHRIEDRFRPLPPPDEPVPPPAVELDSSGQYVFRRPHMHFGKQV